MIEEILSFALILIFQFFTCRLTKAILLRRDIGPFKVIVIPLRYLGVWVHELSHFLTCPLVGVKPKNLVVKFRDEESGRANPHGVVTHEPVETLFQSIFISLAPLLVSTILIYWSLSVCFSEAYDPELRILAGFSCIALFLGGAPSNHDIKNIGFCFKRNPAYSIYQILLVVCSIVMTSILVGTYHWSNPINLSNYASLELFRYFLEYFFNYLFVLVLYFALKFSLLGIKNLYILIANRSTKINPQIRYRTFTRRRFKPKKPKKLGIREAPW